jgi:pimeloyl-ACP methyl ester carboxylesterase
VTKASASPKVDRVIQLRDGRRVAYCEWGDLEGKPTTLLHGQPGSRLFCPDEEATVAAGIRLLTMDRPGYGRSDPHPGAGLLDWASDYVELAEHLDLPPCPVVGWSGGGLYALALGFRVPGRVTAIGLAASPGPIHEVPGALEALSETDKGILALYAVDRPGAHAQISENLSWYAGDGWQQMFDENWGEADDGLLARPEILAPIKDWMREGARQGSAGFEADESAWLTPWGFSVAEVTQPTWVWRGGSDVLVGETETAYLAETIPRATRITFPGEGHLFPIDHWREMLATLLSAVA